MMMKRVREREREREDGWIGMGIVVEAGLNCLLMVLLLLLLLCHGESDHIGSFLLFLLLPALGLLLLLGKHPLKPVLHHQALPGHLRLGVHVRLGVLRLKRFF